MLTSLRVPLLADIPDGSAVTACGRSAKIPRSRFGTEITHCRMGTGGMTWSARVCRRLGHTPAGTRRTDAAALAGKRHQKTMAAA